MANEAVKFVWVGAIPLHIHLHKPEVASHPAPPPALVLAPRIGYLPLLVPLIKPYFKDSLPPGEDSIWFDYKGLPLKWYIPTGALFDLLCAEPERPWNLTIHFRRYPSNILIPCEGEESVKWNFINSMKEAAYIINGNYKNVMNMSQSHQEDLWASVMNARIPVRMYVRSIDKDFENLEHVPEINTWDDVSYLNRPVMLLREEGKCFTLRDAIESLLPEFSGDRVRTSVEEGESEAAARSPRETSEIKLVRIQGTEMKLEIPFSWVVNNLMNPEFYLHISVLVKAPQR